MLGSVTAPVGSSTDDYRAVASRAGARTDVIYASEIDGELTGEPAKDQPVNNYTRRERAAINLNGFGVLLAVGLVVGALFLWLKFGGGGALLVRDFNLLDPMGGHERGYRQGTENVPAALGMAAALEVGDWATTAKDRAGFASDLAASRVTIGEQVDYIFALSHPAMSAQALLIRLDAMGFAVSAGSACSSGTLKKSRVLDAFGIPDDVAARTIRVSLGWNTTTAELDAFLEAWRSLL